MRVVRRYAVERCRVVIKMIKQLISAVSILVSASFYETITVIIVKPYFRKLNTDGTNYHYL